MAERKVTSLLSAGALVTVLSPTLTELLEKLSKKRGKGKVTHIKSRYKEGALEGFFICVSATSSKAITERIRKEATEKKVLLNAVDMPEYCDFIVPSVLKRGALSVAVSTGGKSPALAKKIREELEEMLPEELTVFTELCGAIRNKLLKNVEKSVKNKRLYQEAITCGTLFTLVIENDSAGVDRYLKEVFGGSYSLKRLGVDLKAGRKKQNL